MLHFHREFHKSDRIGWIRAAVLGANDGVISVSSLMIGIAASGAAQNSIMTTGIAGLAAGAMAMAAGEYVSVQSQADTQRADLEKEKHELLTEPDRELAELATIYMNRGLDQPLAQKVAERLTAHDALSAHARDELGITEDLIARPIEAAVASALSFALGAIVPILAASFAPSGIVAPFCFVVALIALIVLGATAAYAGGASIVKGAMRVTFWGVLAMTVTALAGKYFGAAG